MGSVLLAMGKLDDALESYHSALRWTQLTVVDDTKDTKRQYVLSTSYEGMGDLPRAQSRFDEAIKNYRQALALRERLVAGDPRNKPWQVGLAPIHGKLAALYERQGLMSSALTEAKAAHEAIRAVSVNYIDDSVIVYAEGKHTPAAEEWYREALHYEAEVKRLQERAQGRKR